MQLLSNIESKFRTFSLAVPDNEKIGQTNLTVCMRIGRKLY